MGRIPNQDISTYSQFNIFFNLNFFQFLSFYFILLNKNQTSLKKGNENDCLFLHKYFLNQDLSKLRKKNPNKLEFQKIFRKY
ncbi:hypothetical protein BpHYR1_017554 [Brachionus plicatilis]|uniref:Transmembrane protein n=1 Tax=Brachionus plicatilis TaxID=10195 RepID=A0A3M7Q598_BRAPC|nr:hypothetical protein BpHYR1_017554 [Brachionus plicatilis]